MEKRNKTNKKIADTETEKGFFSQMFGTMKRTHYDPTEFPDH